MKTYLSTHLTANIKFVLLLLILPVLTLQAQLIPVTSTMDSGIGSLRQVINNASDGDTIVFNSLTDGIPIVLTSGAIDITTDLVIMGNDSSNTILSGGSTNGIFNIANSNVEIEGIQFINGVASSGGAVAAMNSDLEVRSSLFMNNTAGILGGALFLEGGSASITESSFLRNEADVNQTFHGGGAIGNDGGNLDINNTTFAENEVGTLIGSGGAIFNTSGGIITASNTTFSGNTSYDGGGAIYDVSGAASLVSLSDVTIANNTAEGEPGLGGGIEIGNNGAMSISNSMINVNTATGSGGGIWIDSADVSLNSVLLEGNIANGQSGIGGGGAVFNNGGTLTVQDSSRITANLADGPNGNGGAIYNASNGALTIEGSVLSSNISNQSGGALADFSGSATLVSLTDVMINDNSTIDPSSSGGGIYIADEAELMVSGGAISDNTASFEGGGIWNGDGSLTINGTAIERNESNGPVDAALGGGGIFNNGVLMIGDSAMITFNTTTRAGGGIFSNTSSELNIDEATISNNTASAGGGGGIADLSGAATISNFNNVIIEANTASDSLGTGGGIFISGEGDAVINGGTINGNEAAEEGGGIWSGAGNLTISGTVINENTAMGDASGLGGGGILNVAGDLNLTAGVTVNNNSAAGALAQGGGIYIDEGTQLNMDSVTLANNISSNAGGGIADLSGSTTVSNYNNVTVESNTASDSLGMGGGIYISGEGAAMISASTIAQNEASVEGGGIWSGSGDLSISGSNINENVSLGTFVSEGGGGIYNLAGNLTLSAASSVSGNTANGIAANGGGILANENTDLNLDEVTVSNNSSSNAGGGIADLSGSATVSTITNTTLEANTASDSLGMGGGIYISGDGAADITATVVAGNEAAVEGGGIWSGTGDLSISESSISNNSASGLNGGLGGGGVFNQRGTLTIENGSSVDNNIAEGNLSTGGGVHNHIAGELVINNSSISGNASSNSGGGIADLSGPSTITTLVSDTIENNVAAGDSGNGGGIYISGDGAADITATVVAGNEAAVEGGGIWSETGDLTLEETSVNANTSLGENNGLGGGGIFSLGGSLLIMSGSSIEGNTSSGPLANGGGIFNTLNGELVIAGSSISSNVSSNGGGGIADLSDSTSVTVINDSRVELNSATNDLGNGGGILASGNGNLIITASSISGNNASFEGGGIWSGEGDLTLRNTRVDSNLSSGGDLSLGGGGVFNLAGSMIIENGVQITANTAEGDQSSGGGIFSSSDASISIDSAIISHNTANSSGGGISIVLDSQEVNVITNSAIMDNMVIDSFGTGGGIYISNEGEIDILDSRISNNVAPAQGGGVWNASGDLTFRATLIDSNTVTGHANGLGGGIFHGAGGDLIIDSTSISSNTSTRAGGGVAMFLDSIEANSMINSIVEGNAVSDSLGTGGGIYVSGQGQFDASGTLISNNEAASGGGVYNETAIVTLIEVSMEGNTANGLSSDNGGGAIFNQEGSVRVEATTIANNSATGTAGNGGGIFNTENSTTTVIRSTLSGNESANAGGGVYNEGEASLSASTLTLNSSVNAGGGIQQAESENLTGNEAATQLNSSLIANNSANGSGNDISSESGSIQSGGYNLIGMDDADAFSATSTDQVGDVSDPIEAMLGALEDNGGSTRTHAIDCSSPAVNSGDPALTMPDQRGESVFEQRDIGSFEYQDSCETTNIDKATTQLQGSSIYPNPISNDRLTVELAETIESEASITFIEAASGKEMHAVKLNERTSRISIGLLNSGTYIVKINKDGKVAIHKLLVIQ